MVTIECKAILFDLDGTLVDSGACIDRLWSNWAKENHLDVDYVISNVHGKTIEETLKLISPHFNNQKCVDEIKSLAIKELSQVKPIVGAIDFIKKLPVDCYGIVTSGPKNVSMQSVISAGIPLPNLMITAEDITYGKPNPEPYLKASEDIGVPPHECLVFEDAAPGISSALAAGMRVVIIGNNGQQLLDRELLHIVNYENICVKNESGMITLNW